MHAAARYSIQAFCCGPSGQDYALMCQGHSSIGDLASERDAISGCADGVREYALTTDLPALQLTRESSRERRAISKSMRSCATRISASL